MELQNKVKDELEKKGYDFDSDFWTDELLVLLFDTIYATEKILKDENKKRFY